MCQKSHNCKRWQKDCHRHIDDSLTGQHPYMIQCVLLLLLIAIFIARQFYCRLYDRNKTVFFTFLCRVCFTFQKSKCLFPIKCVDLRLQQDNQKRVDCLKDKKHTKPCNKVFTCNFKCFMNINWVGGDETRMRGMS